MRKDGQWGEWERQKEMEVIVHQCCGVCRKSRSMVCVLATGLRGTYFLNLL